MTTKTTSASPSKSRGLPAPVAIGAIIAAVAVLVGVFIHKVVAPPSAPVQTISVPADVAEKMKQIPHPGAVSSETNAQTQERQ